MRGKRSQPFDERPLSSIIPNRRLPAILALCSALMVLLWLLVPGPALTHPHGNWGSVYRSIDGGRIWEDLNRYRPVTTVYDLSAPRPPRVWAATDEGLLRTNDLGQRWAVVESPALSGVTIVDEDPDDASILVGGPDGLFRASSNLSIWTQVLDESAGQPLSISRDGPKVFVRTTRGSFQSQSRGRRFASVVSGAQIATAGENVASLPRQLKKKLLAVGSAEGVTVIGTTSGAYVSEGGRYELIPFTERFAVHAVLAGRPIVQDAFLLGTSRGLWRYDPARHQLDVVPDIPPFLSVGVLEGAAARPDELFIGTSVRPYPEFATHIPQPSKLPGIALVTGIVSATLAAFALLTWLRKRRVESSILALTAATRGRPAPKDKGARLDRKPVRRR